MNKQQFIKAFAEKANFTQKDLLTLDSASVNDIYGRHNNKLEKKFKLLVLEHLK